MFTSLFSRRSIIASLALAAATVVSPALNSAAEAAGNWVLLGTERVGNHPDRDIIHIGRDEGRFEKLMLKVTGNDIHVGDVKVVYANGSSEHLNVQEYVRDGQSTSALDLRGHHRAIERVELLYQADRPRFRQARVHVYGQPTDMRKSYDGLYALTRHALGQEPMSGELFVYINRRGTQIKVLYWDRSGFCVWAKRLEQGRFVSDWKRVVTKQMDWTGLKLLLEGIEPKVMRKRYSSARALHESTRAKHTQKKQTL